LRLTIEEEPIAHAVWGSFIDVEVADEGEELAVLELAERFIKRRHSLKHDGEEVSKTVAERVRELRGKGVFGKTRGGRVEAIPRSR
jgi:hypothetical protein